MRDARAVRRRERLAQRRRDADRLGHWQRLAGQAIGECLALEVTK